VRNLSSMRTAPARPATTGRSASAWSSLPKRVPRISGAGARCRSSSSSRASRSPMYSSSR
jgi:hypothetical protein